MQVLTPPCPCPKTTPSLTQKLHKHHRTLNSPKQLKLTKSNQHTTTTTQKPIKPILKTQNPINENNKRDTKITTTSDVLKLLDVLNLKVPVDMYIDFIKECTLDRDLDRAFELHNHIRNNGLGLDLDFCNRVLIMYLSCGFLEGALKVFDEMPRRDFYSWVVMMVGMVDEGFYREGLDMFVGMLKGRGSMAGLPSWVLVCVLNAACSVKDLEVGRQVHGGLVKLGYVDDVWISTRLIDLYGKLGCLQGAKVVLDQALDQDTVLWTAKIVNECRRRNFVGVIHDFNEMGRVGIEKNGFTFSSVLRACGRLKDNGVCGRQVHAGVIKLGLESESFVECALIDMYGKSGMLNDARKVFEITRDKKNVACWNAMVSSYTHHGLIIEAFKTLNQMKAAKMEPQVSIISSVKIACGSNSNSEINVSQYLTET